jgi:hypothetical protein
MERCPNCRARWDGNDACRRCGMDLSSLLAVERTAEQLIRRGICHLASTRPEAARRDFTRALRLQSAPFTEVLLGFERQTQTAGREHLAGVRQGLADENHD